MDSTISSEFIRKIPKTDVHLHLDGSLRIPTLIELAREGNIELPSYEENGLREQVFPDAYASLPDYLKGFAFTVAVLQTPENLERVAYELAQDNLAEGVRYIEVRFAPQLHTHKNFSIEAVVRAACKGLDRAKAEFNQSPAVQSGEDVQFEYGIILCALRSFNEHMSPYYKSLLSLMAYAPRKSVFAQASLELARAAVYLAHEQGLPVVGFDLAGEESGYPAEGHREAYQHAHSHFIKKTVHAGEAYGPESIFQAITVCHANRLGHGTFLFADEMIQDPAITDAKAYVKHLAEYIASQRITIEVNLTSNLQTTPSIESVANHPLKKMLDHNLSVTLCTDNRLMSNTSVSQEIELAVNNLPISRYQLYNMVIAGFKGSFFPGSYNQKRAYVRQVINRYKQLEREMIGPK